jgi:hypothetical protein
VGESQAVGGSRETLCAMDDEERGNQCGLAGIRNKFYGGET